MIEDNMDSNRCQIPIGLATVATPTTEYVFRHTAAAKEGWHSPLSKLKKLLLLREQVYFLGCNLYCSQICIEIQSIPLSPSLCALLYRR